MSKSNIFGLNSYGQVRVAIIGSQCSGKTTLMNIVKHKLAEFGNVEILKFADPIYAALGVLKKPKHRMFMQDFSTVAQACFGLHVFSELFEKNILELVNSSKSFAAFLCDDVRRDYELDMVKKYGFTTVFVDTPEDVRRDRAERQGLQFLTTHDSEKYVDDMKGLCDIIVDGNVPKNKLHEYVEAVLQFQKR